MSLEEFQRAVNSINNLTFRPSDQSLLNLYGLYKQATVGNINTAKPSFWDMKGQAKWSAWESLRGLSKEQARGYYIKVVHQILNRRE